MQLPLFPLPVVLFPAALMPLHIFEPRYQALLADCAEGTHRFCLLAPAPDGGTPEVGSVGSIARIRAVQPLTEGRSNIVISGEGRCTLERVVESDKPYLIGELAAFDDLPDVQVPTPHDVQTLLALGERYAAALAALNDVEREPDFTDDPGTLSFQVAALLEWNVARKQRFLGVRSATERVARLLHAVPALLADLETRADVHRRAARNGTGRPSS
jgi:Lon protease-like protein